MRHVETTIRVEAPPEVLIRAFSDVEAMRQWWGVDCGLVKPQEDGVWALACEHSSKGVSAGLRGIHFRHFTLSHLSERLVWGTPTH